MRMPGSDELFHGGKKIAPSMFSFSQPTRGGMTDGEPTADEVAQGFDALLHDKHVNLKEVNVKIFNLSVQVEREEYCKLYLDLYAKVQTKTALVRSVERKFVELPSPTWLIYLEWWIYALEVDGKEVTPEELAEIKKKDSPLHKTDDPDPPADAGHTEGENNEGEDG